MKKLLSFTLILTLLITIGCSVDEPNEITQFENTSSSLIDALNEYNSITGKRDRPPILADCKMYTGIVTPAKFNPAKGKFDELYAIIVDDKPTPAFKYGFPLISDSKPGDQDYNGGRWHMNVYVGDNPESFAGACSEEDIKLISYANTENWDMTDFMSTDAYFECPMIRFKN